MAEEETPPWEDIEYEIVELQLDEETYLKLQKVADFSMIGFNDLVTSILRKKAKEIDFLDDDCG